MLGLDYPAVRAAAEMLEITMTADLFARLRVLEGEVLRVSREAARLRRLVRK